MVVAPQEERPFQLIETQQERIGKMVECIETLEASEGFMEGAET
jgi:hypothetical protein